MKRARGGHGTRRAPVIGPVDVVNALGAEKMSEVLGEFLGPYLKQTTTPEDFRNVLDIGVIAWNAALVAGKVRQELLEATLASLPADARGPARALLEEMIRRKEALFASNQRMIVEYELTRAGPGKAHLSVTSTFDGE
jgi:hypothetical protein